MALFFFVLTAAYIRNSDGTINYSRSMASWLQGDFRASKIYAAEKMTLPEFLKEAMNPDGLSMKERRARANKLAGKKVDLILPEGCAPIRGGFEHHYTAEIYYKNNRIYERNKKYTGNVDITYDFDNSNPPWDCPIEKLIKSINAFPGMKLIKLGEAHGERHTQELYRLECKGRMPVILLFEDDTFFRELWLDHELATNKKELQKIIGK